MKRKEIRRRLDEAIVTEKLVWVEQLGGEGSVHGFVVGVGDEWVLIQRVPGGSLRCNGYVALRVAEIGRIEENDTFAPTALKLMGERPRPQPDLLLIDLPGLLSSATPLFPLVGLYFERGSRFCWIGRVASLGSKKALLHTLSRDGSWSRQRKVRYESIWQVELGGGYLEGLWLVAGRARRETR